VFSILHYHKLGHTGPSLGTFSASRGLWPIAPFGSSRSVQFSSVQKLINGDLQCAEAALM